MDWELNPFNQILLFTSDTAARLLVLALTLLITITSRGRGFETQYGIMRKRHSAGVERFPAKVKEHFMLARDEN